MLGSTAVVFYVPSPLVSYGPFIFNSVLYSYDWLLSISEEVEIVSQSGLTWSIAIYFMSRASQFVYLILALASTQPLAKWVNCTGLSVGLFITSSLTIASTSFLFFLRVRAVYFQSRTITILFGALWVVTTGFNILYAAFDVLTTEHLPAPYCTNFIVTYNYMTVAVTFVYDTMVFLAISCRLAANAVTAGDWRSRVLSIVTGKGLFSLSRSLMKGGQVYYFATTVLFFANLAMLISCIRYRWLRYALIGLNLGFTNMMACIVFRGVALGQIQKTPTEHGLTSSAMNVAFQMDVLPTSVTPRMQLGGASTSNIAAQNTYVT